MKRIVALIVGLYLLAGCGGEPTPTPDAVATRVAVERAAAATLTALAPTATNTPTATKRPSATPRPMWTLAPMPGSTGDESTLGAALGTPLLTSPESAVDDAEGDLIALALAGAAGFLLGTTLTALSCQGRYKRALQEQTEASDKERRSEVRKLKKEHQAQVAGIESAQETQVANLCRRYEEQIAEARTAGRQVYEKERWQTWFEMLRDPPWTDRSPEVEIEVKFVFPLLQVLGYQDAEVQLRAPVTVQHGRMESSVQADLVVRDAAQKTLLVVEAKAPCVELDEGARKQAQSYAFQLGAPAYVLTNGRELCVYHRGVLEDRCVLSCSTAELGERWEQVKEVAGRESVAALRSQLDVIE